MSPVTVPPVIPTLLPYADLPARWGVTIDRWPGCARVVVPPVPSWRDLGKPILISAPVIAAFVLTLGILATRQGNVVGAVVNTIVYGSVLVAVVMTAVERLRGRVMFEVSADRFSVTLLKRRKAGRHFEWPREAIGFVKVNPYTGKLLVQVIGMDQIEWYVGPNREVAEVVAATLSTALAEQPAGTAPGAARPPPPHVVSVGGGPGPVARLVLKVIGVLLLLTGLAMLLLPWEFRMAACYPILFAGIPFGIVYGTQDKEYYG